MEPILIQIDDIVREATQQEIDKINQTSANQLPAPTELPQPVSEEE